MKMILSGRNAVAMLIAVAWSIDAAGAAPAPATQTQGSAAAADTDAPAGDRRLNELFYQLQLLQQEVAEARDAIVGLNGKSFEGGQLKVKFDDDRRKSRRGTPRRY